MHHLVLHLHHPLRLHWIGGAISSWTPDDLQVQWHYKNLKGPARQLINILQSPANPLSHHWEQVVSSWTRDNMLDAHLPLRPL